MGKFIVVGMADVKVCISPEGITTLGLGSCVGIALRDPVTKVGGLAHIMLPDSRLSSNNTNIYKFADTGIAELVKQMKAKGAVPSRIVAKIAGGAQMFSFHNKSEMTRIGEKNVLAVKRKLAEMGIRIIAEDTGLNYGRTVVFFPETGDFIIKAVGKGEKTI